LEAVVVQTAEALVKNIMRGKLFWLAFTVVIAVFVFANVLDYWWSDPPCCDFSIEFGVPIAFGRKGGFVGVTTINWVNLFFSVAIVSVISIPLALIAEKAIRMTARHFR
jgi:hypothetical protein